MNIHWKLVCVCSFVLFTIARGQTGLSKLKVQFVTWNVHESVLDDIKPLLNPPQYNPDLIVIGFQEVKISLMQPEPWVKAMTNYLDKFDYGFVKTEQLAGGILMMVFMKHEHLKKLENVQSTSVKTGFAGWWGNKGAVAVRFEMNGRSMAFVNSHLPPHQEQLDKRVMIYKAIVDQMKFKKSKLMDHDVVFWMGDLNFRIDDLSTKEVLEMIQQAKDPNLKAKVVSDLMAKDQLKKVMKDKSAFDWFNEGVPDFMPTYKYITGTDEYKSDQRKPAYTDRVLYRLNAADKVHVTQEVYSSIHSLKNSDHKPVTAVFQINF